MSDIFISYTSNDSDRAAPLAEALRIEGWTVFWDRTVPVGMTWRQFIARELAGAHGVVVLWSEQSIKSHWVIEESDEALAKKRLIPVLLEQVDPPLGFRGIQAVRLMDWTGDRADPEYQKLVAAIRRVIEKPASVREKTPPDLALPDLSPPGPEEKSSPWEDRLSPKRIGAGWLRWVGSLLVILGLGLGIFTAYALNKHENLPGNTIQNPRMIAPLDDPVDREKFDAIRDARDRDFRGFQLFVKTFSVASFSLAGLSCLLAWKSGERPRERVFLGTGLLSFGMVAWSLMLSRRISFVEVSPAWFVAAAVYLALGVRVLTVSRNRPSRI